MTPKYVYRIMAGATFILLLAACHKFEYSPYQTDADDHTPPSNPVNIEKIKSGEASADDTVTIIYAGDSQRFYDRLQDMVSKVNTLPNIDFFVLCGDVADFGIKQEYVWVAQQLQKLNTPYLSVIGNHDMAANNGKLFNRVFGENNFSFSYKGYKFLFHDTNSREYNFNGTVPNLNWLTNELNDVNASWFIGISHVPPFDPDFDRNLEVSYKNLFSSKPNFLLSLHGHIHMASDDYPYADHVRYMTCNAVQSTEVTLLKFINGTIIKQTITY